MWAAGRSLFGIHFMTWCWKYILHLDGAGITDESVQLRVIKNLQNKVCIKHENLNLISARHRCLLCFENTCGVGFQTEEAALFVSILENNNFRQWSSKIEP